MNPRRGVPCERPHGRLRMGHRGIRREDEAESGDSREKASCYGKGAGSAPCGGGERPSACGGGAVSRGGRAGQLVLLSGWQPITRRRVADGVKTSSPWAELACVRRRYGPYSPQPARRRPPCVAAATVRDPERAFGPQEVHVFSFSRQRGRVFTAAAALTVLAVPALAGPPPSYGHDFMTIGDPGNRPVNQDEGPRFYPPYSPEGLQVGRVGYRYRMARTEVTVGQWLGFVNAYAPYYDGPANRTEFTSDWIFFDSSLGRYRAIEGSESFAADMGWRYAARYCNWLHNAQGWEQAAFENGAYDTSTFGQNPDGTYTDQVERNPDARFSLPTLDEWTKGMHWDPALNGGEGGYWRYPHSSNLEPFPGPPGNGETNAGTGEYFDVGSYPQSTSPWGLLDGSGGESEWLGAAGSDYTRTRRGSSWAFETYWDQIDVTAEGTPTASIGGLRLVSIVPSPMSSAVFAFMTGPCLSPRRRR